jgi:hypothetical protein
MSECGECTRLEKANQAAHVAGDKSKVSDCVVLLRRHPNHGEQTAERGGT